jgi:hypothetical protein
MIRNVQEARGRFLQIRTGDDNPTRIHTAATFKVSTIDVSSAFCKVFWRKPMKMIAVVAAVVILFPVVGRGAETAPVKIFVTSSVEEDSIAARARTEDSKTASLIQQIKELIRKRKKDTLAVVEEKSSADFIVALDAPESRGGRSTVNGLVFSVHDTRAKPNYVGANYEQSFNSALAKTVDGIEQLALHPATPSTERQLSTPIRMFITPAALPGGFVDPSPSASQSIEGIRKLLDVRTPRIIELTDDVANADLVLTVDKSKREAYGLGTIPAQLTTPKTTEFKLDVNGGCYNDVDRGCPSGIRRVTDRVEEFVRANAEKLLASRPKP